ncbi:MAG: hypothetical protein IPN56_04810 [Chitinophagaceae bacterium]|nr:hypothetical protein [Chitinophagaceae bacterium]
MKQAIIFISFITIVAGCNNNKEKNEKDPITDVSTTAVTPDPAKDSAAIRAVILDFYNWYTKEYKQLMGYNLYSGLKKQDAPPYKINWEEVKKYQQFIRSNIPQLGEEFLKNQEKMLQQADSVFKVDTEDDIPYGFDYDWYTSSQEDPSYLLDGINKSGKWIINVKGEEASVEIGAPDDKDYLAGSLLLYVGMKKENGQWKIARIGGNE